MVVDVTKVVNDPKEVKDTVVAINYTKVVKNTRIIYTKVVNRAH